MNRPCGVGHHGEKHGAELGSWLTESLTNIWEALNQLCPKHDIKLAQ